MNPRARAKRRTIERLRGERAWGRMLQRAWHDHYRPTMITLAARDFEMLGEAFVGPMRLAAVEGAPPRTGQLAMARARWHRALEDLFA